MIRGCYREANIEEHDQNAQDHDIASILPVTRYAESALNAQSIPNAGDPVEGLVEFELIIE